MDFNIVGIGFFLGGFFTWYYNDQKKQARRRRVQPRPEPMPDLHTDSFTEDSQPILTDAHTANMLGPRQIGIISENDAFFLPAELTDIKSETLSLREYSTGRTPQHRELLIGGTPNVSAIPWVQTRSHVVAENFLKKEGLIPNNEYSESYKNYFEIWPEPKQHPYMSDQ